MTLLTAEALTDPQLPETASNVCTTDARLGGVGRVPLPNNNPGYAGDRPIVQKSATAIPTFDKSCWRPRDSQNIAQASLGVPSPWHIVFSMFVFHWYNNTNKLLTIR